MAVFGTWNLKESGCQSLKEIKITMGLATDEENSILTYKKKNAWVEILQAWEVAFLCGTESKLVKSGSYMAEVMQRDMGTRLCVACR